MSVRKRTTNRWVRGGFALLAAGVGGGVGFVLLSRRRRGATPAGAATRDREQDRWARPGMAVTFRAELMPSRERGERTFRVAELLPGGRVALEGFGGEHAENEFEPAR